MTLSPVENKKLVEPSKPAPQQITYTVPEGGSLFAIAMKYHTDVSAIMKANNLTNSELIKPGQVLKFQGVTKDRWDRYQNALSDYYSKKYEIEQQLRAQKEAELFRQKIAEAEANIQKAREDKDLNKKYTFTLDRKTGHITVTLKKGTELGDLRKDFHLPKGHLRKMNSGITKKYKPGTDYNLLSFDIFEPVRKSNWDEAKASAGDKFIIDGNAFKP